MPTQADSLDEVFSPRSVAIVGATEYIGEHQMYGRSAVERLLEVGFPTIYPVNPKRSRVLGLPCYPNLTTIPGEVDHVVIAIPAEAALAVLDECGTKAVKSVHMFTAGFSESGYAGRAKMEKSLLEKARRGGFRIFGPNCMGMYLPRMRFTTWANVPMEPGPIGLLSQSGGFAEDIPFDGDGRGLRFSKAVSYGNGLDVNESELLEYFARDAETGIIAAYIEGVKDANRFRKALEAAAARKPVVVHKGGVTRAGGRAARSHTASLAGSADTFRILFRQVNAIQVDSKEELVDMLVAFRFIKPVPKGGGVAVVGRGGGASVLAGDEIEAEGLSLPPIPQSVQKELAQFLNETGGMLANPVEAMTLLSPEAALATMRVLGQIDDISLFLYHIGYHPSSRWNFGRLSSEAVRKGLAEALGQVRGITGKPVVVALNPPPNMEGMKDFVATRETFACADIPVFFSMRRAALAVSRLLAWNCRRASH